MFQMKFNVALDSKISQKHLGRVLLIERTWKYCFLIMHSIIKLTYIFSTIISSAIKTEGH